MASNVFTIWMSETDREKLSRLKEIEGATTSAGMIKQLINRALKTHVGEEVGANTN